MDLAVAISCVNDLLEVEVHDGDWEIKMLEFIEDGGLEALANAAWKYHDLCD